MRKKYTILTIGLILFFVLVYFLYTPSNSDSNFMEKKTDDDAKETTRVKDDVNLIDYLNLEAENRKLIQEIDTLKTELFEFHKALIDPESNEIMPHFKNLNALTVYKEVSEDEIILLVRNETDDSYTLSITSKEIGY